MRKIIYILASFVLLSLLASCHRHNKEMHTIRQALSLAANYPDSALHMLDHMDKSKLDDEGCKALYALAYYMAQDKSGLDVDNDSLIRMAYSYFEKHPTDSLYGKCMYYMGKYYQLNDSTEQSLYCFNKADSVCVALKDTAYQCMVLGERAKRMNTYDLSLALTDINRTIELYSHYSAANKSNMACYTMVKAECLAFSDSVDAAIKCLQPILNKALADGDSAIVSDIYQDLESIVNLTGDYTLANKYAIMSCQYAKEMDNSKLLALAESYEYLGKYEECMEALDKIESNDDNILYSAYYTRHRAAIRCGDLCNALAYADSAYDHLENMYRDSQNRNNQYYPNLLKKNKQTAYAEGKASLWLWVVALLSVTLLVAAFSLYYYLKARNLKQRMERVKWEEKVAYEQKLRQEEKRMAEEIHQRELAHKEAQIDILRQSLVRKIEILDKLEALKTGARRHLEMTVSDWDEVEAFLENTQDGFVSKVKETFSDLNEDTVRLLMLVRIGLPTKSLGVLYGISEDSMKHKLYMLKKKLGITDKTVSVRTYLSTL